MVDTPTLNAVIEIKHISRNYVSLIPLPYFLFLFCFSREFMGI